MQTYLEDSPRIILIVGDTTVAHSSLGHNGRIEPIVGVRTVRCVVAVVSLAAGNELADCGIPPVLLLDLAVSAAPYEQEGSTSNCCSEDDKAHYDACCNCSLVSRRVASGRVCWPGSDYNGLVVAYQGQQSIQE